MKLLIAVAVCCAACTFDPSASGVGAGDGAGVDAAPGAPDGNTVEIARLGGQQQAVDPDTGHCYMLFDQRERWDGARAACEAMSAHLVTIASAQENDLVVSLTDCYECRDRIWLGLNDEASEDYEWTTAEPVVFTNWRSGSPDSGSQHCVVMYTPQYGESGDVGAWNDFYCNEYQSFVCERSR